MTNSNEMFNQLVEQRLQYTKDTLISKAKEYASDKDRLHNFKMGAGITRQHPAQVCLGFMTKHLVSVIDLVNDLAKGNHLKVTNLIDEKLGDSIIYMILLEAIIKEDVGMAPYVKECNPKPPTQ